MNDLSSVGKVAPLRVTATALVAQLIFRVAVAHASLMLSYLDEGVKKRGPGYEQHDLDGSGSPQKTHASSVVPMPVERPVPAASQPLSIGAPSIQPFSTPPPPGSLLANFLAFDLVAQEVRCAAKALAHIATESTRKGP